MKQIKNCQCQNCEILKLKNEVLSDCLTFYEMSMREQIDELATVRNAGCKAIRCVKGEMVLLQKQLDKTSKHKS